MHSAGTFIRSHYDIVRIWQPGKNGICLQTEVMPQHRGQERVQKEEQRNGSPGTEMGSQNLQSANRALAASTSRRRARSVSGWQTVAVRSLQNIF